MCNTEFRKQAAEPDARMNDDVSATTRRFQLKLASWQGALLCLVLCGIGAGCQSSATSYSSAFAPFDSGTANYPTNRLQEGDVVSITFQYSTNLNATQKISLDGTLSLEGVGTVK